MSQVHFFRNDVRTRLKDEYTKRIAAQQGQMGALELDRKAIVAQESRWARRHLLLTEKNLVIDAFRRGLLDQAVYKKLPADIDALLLRLEPGEEEKTTGAQPVATNGDRVR